MTQKEEWPFWRFLLHAAPDLVFLYPAMLALEHWKPLLVGAAFGFGAAWLVL